MTLAAFRQIQMHAAERPKPSLHFAELISAAVHGEFQAAFSLGAGPLVWALASLALGAGRAWSARRAQPPQAPPAWWLALAALTGIVLCHLMLFQFLVPASPSDRVILTVPYAFLSLAVGASHARPLARRLLLAGALLAMLAQVAVYSDYLLQLRQTWELRSAGRFNPIMELIPADAQVAAVPEFWYAFRKDDRQVAVIYQHYFGEDQYWKEDPHAFDSYDTVILDPGDSDYEQLRDKARAGHPVELVCSTYQRDFVVLARRLRTDTGKTCHLTTAGSDASRTPSAKIP
jgi:hypothetical protein